MYDRFKKLIPFVIVAVIVLTALFFLNFDKQKPPVKEIKLGGVTTVYASTTDDSLATWDSTWYRARNNSTTANLSAEGNTLAENSIYWEFIFTGYFYSSRYFLSFDTSSVGSQVMSSVTLNFYVYNDNLWGNPAEGFGVKKGTFSLPLTATDANYKGYTGTGYGTTSVATTTTGSWKQITVPTADINTSGYSKFVIMTDHDYSSTTPTNGSGYAAGIATANDATHKPYLTINISSSPTINSWTASPSQVLIGSSTTLSWNVSDVNNMMLTGNNLSQATTTATGSYTFAPNATGTQNYVLAASSSEATIYATTTVTVTDVPIVNTLSITPGGTCAGTGTLAWSVFGDASTTINQGIGDVASTSSQTVSLGKTYTLTAVNKNGTTTSSVVATSSSCTMALTLYNNQIFQRNAATSGVVTFTGTSSAGYSMSALSFKVVKASSTGTVIQDWTTVTPIVSGTNWRASTTIPVNNTWYYLVWRDDAGGNTSTSTSRWTVGDLYGIIGQSNMACMFTETCIDATPILTTASNTSASVGYNSLFAAGGLSFYLATSTNWSGLAGEGAISLANRYSTYMNVPIGFIEFAGGSTGLHQAYEGIGYWLDFSATSSYPLYQNFLFNVNVYGGRLAGIMWIQGESDARGELPYATYYSDMDIFLNRIRNDIGYAFATSGTGTVPFFEGQIGRCNGDVVACIPGNSGDDNGWQNIRDAQKDWAVAKGESNNVYWAADTIDLPLDSIGIHHSNVGFREMGKRFAQTALYHYGKVSYYRGPQITSKRINPSNGSQAIITIQHGAGSNYTPSMSIDGFIINGATSTVSTTSQYSATQIAVTKTTPFVSTDNIQYMWGVDPCNVYYPRGCSMTVFDNTELVLPLEGNTTINFGIPTNYIFLKRNVNLRSNIRINTIQ